jgi:CheY-like chemotaxis protein
VTLVLVVDDDEGFRSALGSALEFEGFCVEFAENGRAALERLTRGSPLPEAMVVDLMMPVMNGWEFLEAVQRYPSFSRIPTVVVSAARNPGRIPLTIKVLQKPVDLLDLTNFLEQATASRNAPRTRDDGD